MQQANYSYWDKVNEEATAGTLEEILQSYNSQLAVPGNHDYDGIHLPQNWESSEAVLIKKLAIEHEATPHAPQSSVLLGLLQTHLLTTGPYRT